MRILLILMLVVFSPFNQASTVKLNYSIFFNYMKTMYKLDYDLVSTGFYLVDQENKSLCTINQAEMVMENKHEPILFQPEGRLFPFYSDQHRKDGAVLVVDINDQKEVSSCALQITIMAKESELFDLNTPKLAKISEQLEGVLNKNAGMIGKYFLPTFNGLRIQLSTPLTKSQLDDLQISIADNGDLLLTESDFSKIQKINELNLLVTRITPWILKNK